MPAISPQNLALLADVKGLNTKTKGFQRLSNIALPAPLKTALEKYNKNQPNTVFNLLKAIDEAPFIIKFAWPLLRKINDSTLMGCYKLLKDTLILNYAPKKNFQAIIGFEPLERLYETLDIAKKYNLLNEPNATQIFNAIINHYHLSSVNETLRLLDEIHLLEAINIMDILSHPDIKTVSTILSLLHQSNLLTHNEHAIDNVKAILKKDPTFLNDNIKKAIRMQKDLCKESHLPHPPANDIMLNHIPITWALNALEKVKEEKSAYVSLKQTITDIENQKTIKSKSQGNQTSFSKFQGALSSVIGKKEERHSFKDSKHTFFKSAEKEQKPYQKLNSPRYSSEK